MGTEHYNLKQWESWEGPSQAGLNAAMEGVDTALAGVEEAAQTAGELAEGRCRMVYGSYFGDDIPLRTISLPFAPSAVLLEQRTGVRLTESGDFVLAGLALRELPLKYPSEAAAGLELDETGFKVRSSGHYHLNQSGTWYYYVALA